MRRRVCAQSAARERRRRDIRQLTVGSRLHLPVHVEGALLSLGDAHFAQGDGESCGTR